MTTFPITDTEIVVAGAGPVGLAVAIQAARLGKKITVVEKYLEYQRSEIYVSIVMDSLWGFADDPVLSQLAKEWGNRTVSIKVIQEALTQRAKELGIRVILGHTAVPADLPAQFPNAKVFIGADGARSKMRSFVSGDEFKFNYTLQYLVQVQYIVTPPKEEETGEFVSYASAASYASFQKVKSLSEVYRSQKFAGHLINETIKPQADGSSKVTLQIFVDQATHEKMGDATFGTPYYMDQDLHKVPENVREILIKWWGAREEAEGEIIMQDPERKNKITVIALGAAACKDFVRVDKDGRVWTVVGDAASFFPFFRAINRGYINSTYLAHSIRDAYAGPTFNPSAFDDYSYYATRGAYLELSGALAKNVGVNASNLWVKWSGHVPWEINKFSAAAKARYYQRGQAIWDRLSQQ